MWCHLTKTKLLCNGRIYQHNVNKRPKKLISAKKSNLVENQMFNMAAILLFHRLEATTPFANGSANERLQHLL